MLLPIYKYSRKEYCYILCFIKLIRIPVTAFDIKNKHLSVAIAGDGSGKVLPLLNANHLQEVKFEN